MVQATTPAESQQCKACKALLKQKITPSPFIITTSIFFFVLIRFIIILRHAKSSNIWCCYCSNRSKMSIDRSNKSNCWRLLNAIVHPAKHVNCTACDENTNRDLSKVAFVQVSPKGLTHFQDIWTCKSSGKAPLWRSASCSRQNWGTTDQECNSNERKGTLPNAVNSSRVITT